MVVSNKTGHANRLCCSKRRKACCPHKQCAWSELSVVYPTALSPCQWFNQSKALANLGAVLSGVAFSRAASLNKLYLLCLKLANQCWTVPEKALKFNRKAFALSSIKLGLVTPIAQVRPNHLAFSISTAKTCVGPNIFERKTSHFMSGVKVTFGSKL